MGAEFWSIFTICLVIFASLVLTLFKVRGWFRASYEQLSQIKSGIERVEEYQHKLGDRLRLVESRSDSTSESPITVHTKALHPTALGDPWPEPLVQQPVEGDPKGIEEFLKRLDSTPDARGYLEIHMRRLVTTLNAVPPPGERGAALELASYLQMAPVLSSILGYSDVLAAYKGPLGETETLPVMAGGDEIFRCRVDKYDAETDSYPYPDGRFDLVLACELIEHLLQDPMHLVLESRRILAEGGRLLITTPNTTDLDAVAKVLEQTANPQVYSKYSAETGQVPHVREYAPVEIRTLFEAGGFEIETLFTDGTSANTPAWVREFLEGQNLPAKLRGETIYCLGRKRQELPVTRYPEFLYEAY